MLRPNSLYRLPSHCVLTLAFRSHSGCLENGACQGCHQMRYAVTATVHTNIHSRYPAIKIEGSVVVLQGSLQTKCEYSRLRFLFIVRKWVHRSFCI